MNKKLVFFDIDGTLLNDQKTINESTIKVIEELKEKNFIFCLATGRGLTEGILEIAKIAKLNGYLVLGNGNFVWDINNEMLTTLGLPIPEEAINLFYEIALKYKRQLNIFFSDGSIKNYYFGEDINQDITDPNFFLLGSTVCNFSDVNEIQKDLKSSILHISLKAEEEVIKKAYPYLKELEEKELAKISNVLNIYVEAESIYVSKWSGVQYVQNKLEISNENTYAFGDSENDEILLKNVGNSICMGNGSNKIKEIAQTVIGDNNSDAIAEYLLAIK